MTEKRMSWDVGEIVDFLASHSGGEGAATSVEGVLHWAPPADVYESENRLHVVIEIAGMKAGDFDIRLNGEELVVAGERPPRRAECSGRYHSLEWNSGAFRKRLVLPVGYDTSSPKVRYANGVLEISFARKKKERKR